MSDALAGTAIAVALMPPLCVVGLTLSQGQFTDSLGAFLLYMTNLFGITLACQVIFIAAGCAKYRRRGISSWVTIVFTLILALPLGLRTFGLIQQSRIQASIRDLLTRRTITVGQQTQLNRTRIEWDRKVPTVYLYVVADKPPTPRQVGLVEQFLAKAMGRVYEVVFVVSEVQEVRSGVYTPLPQWLQTPSSESDSLRPSTPPSPGSPLYDFSPSLPSPPSVELLPPVDTLSTPTPTPLLENPAPSEDDRLRSAPTSPPTNDTENGAAIGPFLPPSPSPSPADAGTQSPQ